MESHHLNFRLNGNQLKLIAVISMLVDHMAIVLVGWDQPAYLPLRAFGRIAFPIYAFLLTEGFCHTGNLRKYMIRLLIFAVISEIPYDYLAFGNLMDVHGQNVFWTLLLGLLMMRSFQIVSMRFPGAVGRQVQLMLLVVYCAAAWILKVDYDYRGIMLIGLFFWFYGERDRQAAFACVWMVLTASTSGWMMALGYGTAGLLLRHYDSTRGTWNGKVFFYAFYPVHLIILDVIKTLL
ncbi:MAG: TraX family protein [Brotaphodocola sp.]